MLDLERYERFSDDARSHELLQVQDGRTIARRRHSHDESSTASEVRSLLDMRSPDSMLEISRSRPSMDASGLELEPPETVVGSPSAESARTLRFRPGPTAPARGTCDQHLVRISCGLSAGVAIYVVWKVVGPSLRDKAAGLVGVALQNISEAITSLVVWWRFGRCCGQELPVSNSYLLVYATIEQQRTDSRKAEVDRCLSLVMGWVFLIAGGGIYLSTIYHTSTSKLTAEDRDAHAVSTAMAWSTSIFYIVISIMRMSLAIRLNSALMYQAATSAFSSCLFAMMLVTFNFWEQTVENHANIHNVRLFHMCSGFLLALIIEMFGLYAVMANSACCVDIMEPLFGQLQGLF